MLHNNTCHSNVLKSGHELAIKAAERVTRKEAIPSLSEVLINLLELRKQSVLGRLLFLQQHQLEFLLIENILINIYLENLKLFIFTL